MDNCTDAFSRQIRRLVMIIVSCLPDCHDSFYIEMRLTIFRIEVRLTTVVDPLLQVLLQELLSQIVLSSKARKLAGSPRGSK